MSTPIRNLGETVWELPPLILHPFNEGIAPATLLENSRAALMLAGLIPNDGNDPEALKRRLLSGRYSEIRMLFFLGKDIFRWIDDCLEWLRREPALQSAELHSQSFAALLTEDPPEGVQEKLVRWGVADYRSIFSRAVGVKAVLVEPPGFDRLSEELLRNYHRYADALYGCYMDSHPHAVIGSRNFRFQLS